MSLKSKTLAHLAETRAAHSGVHPQHASTEGSGRLALVVGASAGIGRAITEVLAAKGYDLVVVARRTDRLESVKLELENRWGVSVTPVAIDFSEPGAAALLRDRLTLLSFKPDFVAWSAGYDLMGHFLNNSWEAHEQFIRVNATAAIELTYYLLPHMVEQGWGRILNVTSVGAHMAGGPDMSLYVACKSMLLKFSEGIAAEYEPKGVHVTVSLPGVTETEIFEVAGISEFFETNLLSQATMMRPEPVALQAYAACMARERTIVHGLRNQVWVATLMHAPKPLRYRMVKWLEKMQPQTA